MAVDEVSSEQEVLVKSLGSRIRRLRHFSGCTLLPTGQIALVINSANVVRTALGLTSRFDSLSSFAGDPNVAETHFARRRFGHDASLAEEHSQGGGLRRRDGGRR